MPRPKVAVYGLTTEGYQLASRIVEKASVTIVDETLQMAMDIDARMTRDHPSVQALVGDETLMGLKPVSQVLADAAVILFTPKLRKTGDESIIEAGAKLREVAKHVSKGGTIVNFLPTGVGGNADNITFLEKNTGLKAGENLNYAYCPLDPLGEPRSTASLAAKGKGFAPLEEFGLEPSSGSIGALELDYISKVLSTTTSMAAEVELMKKAREQQMDLQRESERYIDELASLLFDLTAVQAGEDVGEPLTYLAGAAIKSLENYERYTVEETRDLLRDLQLKASRTRVVVAWSTDKYEMRADRIETAKALGEKLRDYVTDVQYVETKAIPEDVIDAYKHTIAIVCTQEDLERFKSLKKSYRGSEVSILKATASIGRA